MDTYNDSGSRNGMTRSTQSITGKLGVVMAAMANTTIAMTGKTANLTSDIALENSLDIGKAADISASVRVMTQGTAAGMQVEDIVGSTVPGIGELGGIGGSTKTMTGLTSAGAVGITGPPQDIVA